MSFTPGTGPCRAVAAFSKTPTAAAKLAGDRKKLHQLANRLLQRSNIAPMPRDFRAVPPQHRLGQAPLPEVAQSAGVGVAPMLQTDSHPHSVASTTLCLPSPDGGPSVLLERDPHAPGANSDAVRIALQPNGWREWEWRKHKVNWTAAGTSGPLVVCIHGFGGSVYHWRSTLPALASHCRVYALDCLGFGWADKAAEDYSGYDIWAQQVIDFVEQVVDPREHERVILVGNSLGGFTALQATAMRPDLFGGLVLLNACGAIEEVSGDITTQMLMNEDAKDAQEGALDARKSIAQKLQSVAGTALRPVSNAGLRLITRLYFELSKRPENVRSSLQRLYVSKHRVDDALVESVAAPTRDPGALEVCHAVLATMFSVDRLDIMLKQLKAKQLEPGGSTRGSSKLPILVLWGDQDPWMASSTPDRIRAHYGEEWVDVVRIPDAGHCPQDDAPEKVNAELLKFIGKYVH